MALAAFHGEIARIPLTVREPGVGDIRLQWWRDALATPAGTATGNPVADAMRDVARAHALPVDKLVAMIDAYGRELEAGALTTAAAVDAHAAATQGAALPLAAQIVGCADRRDASAAARGRTSVRDACRFCARCRLSASKGRNPFGDADVAALVPPLLRQAEARAGARRANSPRPRRQPSCLRYCRSPSWSPIWRLWRTLAPMSPTQRADISALTRVWRLLKASALGRV